MGFFEGEGPKSLVTNQNLPKMARVFLAKRAKVAKKVQSFGLYFLKQKVRLLFLAYFASFARDAFSSGLSGLD